MEERIELNEQFEKLMQRANEIQRDCTDHIVTAHYMTMDNDLNLRFNGKCMSMSPVTTSGFCGKLGIPVAYFNRCAESNKTLAALNVNNWLKDDNRKFLIREYRGYARGCLSGSYSKFDAPDLLKALDDVLDMSKYKIKGSLLNEERLHLRIVEKEMLPIDGEDLFAGITIDSSDIGRSGLYVKFLIYKQVCTNGLILPKSSGELFRRRHIGMTSEEFGKSLKEGLESFNDIKEKAIEMIKETKTIPMDVEEINKYFTEEITEEIVTIADARYDRSRWGIINGITEIAQNYTLEKRLAIEQLAGEILTK